MPGPCDARNEAEPRGERERLGQRKSIIAQASGQHDRQRNANFRNHPELRLRHHGGQDICGRGLAERQTAHGGGLQQNPGRAGCHGHRQADPCGTNDHLPHDEDAGSSR